MNDPTFVEAARVFAERIIRECDDNPQDRIRFAYRAAISREPNDEILEVLLAVHQQHLAAYQKSPEEAKQVLETGLAKPPEDLDVVELAAWTGVARTILNLHETNTRY